MEPEYVTFNLLDDPIDYRLAFDFNVICEVEEKTGVNLMRVLGGYGVNAKETRALLYACLKKAHPLVQLPEAGELLTRDMPAVLEAISKVISLAQRTDVKAVIEEGVVEEPVETK